MYCVCFDNGWESENTYFEKDENAKKFLLWYCMWNLTEDDIHEWEKVYLDEYEWTRVYYYRVIPQDYLIINQEESWTKKK